MKGILWAVIQKPIPIQRLYSNGEPHHITLQYGVERELYTHLEGIKFHAVVWAEAWNNRIQALRVTIPDSLPSANAHPHITMSWVDGAKPVESNEMLEQDHEYRLCSPNLFVPCQIEFQERPDVAEGEQ